MSDFKKRIQRIFCTGPLLPLDLLCSYSLHGKECVCPYTSSLNSIVLDLVNQVRDVVLMSVYLDLGNPGGLGFWNEGYMSKGRSVYEQPGNEVDRSYHSVEGFK